MKIDKQDLIIALIYITAALIILSIFEGSVRLGYSTSTKARRIEHEC